MDLKVLRLFEITKFLLDFPQERLQSEDADLMKLFVAPFVLVFQPSERWIEKLDTSDRIDYWRTFSRDFCWIAQYWVSRNFSQNDPLRPLLKAGRITRNKYNILRRSQKVFERLWELCREVEPFIREAFEEAKLECPFSNAGSLFAKVADEMVSAEISAVLNPYI
jgi:hypothetical protein